MPESTEEHSRFWEPETSSQLLPPHLLNPPSHFQHSFLSSVKDLLKPKTANDTGKQLVLRMQSSPSWWKSWSHRSCWTSQAMRTLPCYNSSSHLSAKFISSDPGYFVQFLPARKHTNTADPYKHRRPKAQPTPFRWIPGHKAAGSDLLLVLWLLHFRWSCSSSSGERVEAGFSGTPYPRQGQQALPPQDAKSPKAMLSLSPGYYRKATKYY